MPFPSFLEGNNPPPRAPQLNLNFRKLAIGVAIAFGLLFFLLFATSGCKTINPGNIGIEVSKVGSSRGVQDVTIKTGLVLFDPLTTSIIEYPTFVQTAKWTKSLDEGRAVDESITFTTKDSLVVNADVSISYQLDTERAPAFYVKFRADHIESFTDGYMRNVARDAFNEIAGEYTVEEIMGDNGPILIKVRQRIQDQLKDYVSVNQLGFIGAPRPPASVTEAINMKVEAQQIALQKQNEVAQAEADARKAVAIAEGEAQANIVRAKADSEANRLRSQSLTPQLIEWTKIQKWNGENPSVVSGGAGAGGLIVSVK
jgi:regulator of protease activity HflC (stomatin/prohibitin superfamily)